MEVVVVVVDVLAVAVDMVAPRLRLPLLLPLEVRLAACPLLRPLVLPLDFRLASCKRLRCRLLALPSCCPREVAAA